MEVDEVIGLCWIVCVDEDVGIVISLKLVVCVGWEGVFRVN